MIILIKEEDKEGREFAVEKFPVSIGRSKENTITMPSPYFSRKHCIIEETKKGFRVKDMGSKNGIKVNGQAVQASDLMPGDTLSIGTNDFTLISKKNKDKYIIKDDSPRSSIPYKGEKVSDSAWDKQLEKERVTECIHCGTLYSISHTVPNVGIFCPKCKTQFE
ncbi:FHA domain-containing protein [Planctomycetota bacterium]